MLVWERQDVLGAVVARDRVDDLVHFENLVSESIKGYFVDVAAILGESLAIAVRGTLGLPVDVLVVVALLRLALIQLPDANHDLGKLRLQGLALSPEFLPIALVLRHLLRPSANPALPALSIPSSASSRTLLLRADDVELVHQLFVLLDYLIDLVDVTVVLQSVDLQLFFRRRREAMWMERQVLARLLVAVRRRGHGGRHVVHEGVGVAASFGVEGVKLQDAEALATERHGTAVACSSYADRAAIDYIIEFIHYFNFELL